MKCVYHNDRDAEYICSSCGQPVCRECITVVNGKNVCLSCEYKSHRYEARQYNGVSYKKGDGISGFLFFIFLAVPGLRHMYLGLMKRGLQFLEVFFGAVIIGILLGDGIGEIAIPVAFIIWFYSAFDSYQYRKLLARGEEALDKPLFDDFGIDEARNFLGERKSLIGGIIIIVGIYLLLRRVRWFIGGYGISGRIVNLIFRMIDFGFGSIVPILFIVCGVYLLSRVKKDESARDE